MFFKKKHEQDDSRIEEKPPEQTQLEKVRQQIREAELPVRQERQRRRRLKNWKKLMLL
ncbi:hypothetical protein DGMP_09700 [Desulfomarina profundi]|uniref:Uncharacterized protein n=1 Tax=Desulfomarina profundi TaxID=2772557 RepID=A0A8D5JL75_9BACT|nr:hypothetical protein [Desulfomarina profundi]BCL60277.1 hypothetical protein DGMP_09700 [Desulfomarina profundi]